MTSPSPAAPPPTAVAPSFLRGLAFVLCSALCFGLLDASGKWLSRDHHVLQVVWARYFFAVLVLVPWMGRTGVAAAFRSARPGLQIVRAGILAATSIMFFFAIRFIQLAEAQAISFVAPLVVTALAALVLREHVGPRRWAAVFVGFVGVLVIIRPGAGVMHWAAGIVLLQAVLGAGYHLLTRFLAAHDPARVTFMFTGMVGAVLFSVLAPFVWSAPTPLHWAMMVTMGVFGTVGHWCLIQAYRYAEASSLAPFLYASLPWVTLLGWIVFGDLPDRWTVVGAAIVIASGIYVFYRERHLRRIGRI
ncbi:MAG: DMT family transporter [Alphaproteobacteria bacterium]|nr:DMT family transporter [Alphaproteobacteria bacterium]